MSALRTVLHTLTDDSKDIAQRRTYAHVIQELYRTHGKAIKNPSFITAISQADKALGGLLSVLQENHLITAKHIRQLTSYIEKSYAHHEKTTHVHLTKHTDSDQYTKTIEKHFDNTHTTTNDDIGIKIQHHHTIYKRTRDSDVKQLLT